MLGTLDRYAVERAEVAAVDDTGVLFRTVAHRHPSPRRPFGPKPDPASPRPGLLRIEAVSDRVLRVRYSPDAAIREGGDRMIVAELPPPEGVAIDPSEHSVSIRTSGLTAALSLSPFGLEIRDRAGRPVCRVGGPDRNYFGMADSVGTSVSEDTANGRPVATETFSIGPEDTVYGFGESFTGLDKRGQALDLYVGDAMGVNTPRMYKAVPFFVTTAGYAVFVHTSARVACWVGSRSANEVQVAVDDDVLDYFVFVGSIREALSDYTALTGRPAVPPDWSFGWWQSKCSYVSAEETLDVVRGLRGAGFPVDVIHLDTAWFRQDWRCDLEFDPERFPDPAGYAGKLREMGVHLSLWQMPYLVEGTRLHDRVAGVDGFVKDAHGVPYDVGIHFVQGYRGPVHCIDWTNPAAAAVMQDEYARLLETGASVIKADFGEDAPADGVYHDGTPGHRMHNLYPLLYQRAVHEVAGKVTGDGIAWSRSAWAGAGRYPVHWGGDAPADWEMLGPQLHGGLSLALSGFTFWSADIGGTGDLPHDQELLIRWLQWGLLLSHARIHGMGEREPHRWPEPARTIALDWIRLRYRLLPYLLSTARSSVAAGMPFIRPMVLEFEADPTTWHVGDQFMCGEALLVAPLLRPGGRRRVYLPAGGWFDWWTRERMVGPRWVDVEHDLATSPLFAREGKVVPMGPVQAHVGERPTDPLTLLVAPAEDATNNSIEVPVDGRVVSVEYRAEDGAHRLSVRGHGGRIEVEAFGGVSVETDIDPSGQAR